MDSAFAQTTTTAAPAASDSVLGGLAGFAGYAPMLLILVAFYVIFMLPQNKERKKREELLKNIQRGDRVLTRGGIYATVADIKENVLVLKINENSKVEVDRTYVDSVEKVS
jgi:preprotein translocase subunit YajC